MHACSAQVKQEALLDDLHKTPQSPQADGITAINQSQQQLSTSNHMVSARHHTDPAISSHISSDTLKPAEGQPGSKQNVSQLSFTMYFTMYGQQKAHDPL
jgi:hypothetical protein